MSYNFDIILANPEFIDFNKKMLELGKVMEMNHTMVGFNFKNKQIISTKFYYVFFGKGDIQGMFPILELEKDYKNLLNKKSNYHLTTQYTPGGGITFVVKFDKLLNSTKGFYFRLDVDNRDLINNVVNLYPELNFNINDFENGYGQYVLYDNKSVKFNEYLYLRNTNKIKDTNEIPFSLAKTIELSSSKSINRKENKFIAIGGHEIVNDNFFDQMPNELKKADKSNWVCPAINFETGVRSIYYFNISKVFSSDLFSFL